MSHASEVIQAALLAEVNRLKPFIPETPASMRNIAAIEAQCPPHKMEHDKLCGYVNLLARSIPQDLSAF